MQQFTDALNQLKGPSLWFRQSDQGVSRSLTKCHDDKDPPAGSAKPEPDFVWPELN